MKIKLKSIELYEDKLEIHAGYERRPIHTAVNIKGNLILAVDSVGGVSFKSEGVDLGILSNEAKHKIENMYKDIEAIIQEDLTDRKYV